jgi:hypothetical protein
MTLVNRFGLVVLALCSAAASQGSVISPRQAYTSAEGESFSTFFGAYGDARHQIADGNQRGSAVMLKTWSARHDHREYDLNFGMGRTWRGVQLAMSQCNQPSLTRSFSNNSLATPTLVFSGAVTWPIQLSVPRSWPAPWRLTFPFAGPWSYSGRADILADFRFAGGRLANSAAWSRGATVPYALDSFDVGRFSRAASVNLGNVNGGCVDSGAASAAGSSIKLTTASYNSSVANGAFRDKFQLVATGSNFGASLPVMYVLTFNSDHDGFAFPGIACNRVHLDIRRFWFMHPVSSNALGSVAPYYFGVPSGLTTYNPNYVGVQLVVQGVWTDTRTRGLKLSAAARSGFISIPFGSPPAVKMTALWDANPLASNGSNLFVGYRQATPLVRYGR